MKDIITSSKNQQLKNVSMLLKSKKERDEQGLFVVEGLRIFEDAVKSACPLIDRIFFSEGFYNEHKDIVSQAVERIESTRVELVNDRVFEGISGTVTPQGVLCVLRRPEYTTDDIIKRANEKNGCRSRILLLEDIQDPGNLGTMLRTCEASGTAGIIMSRGTADIFNPKVTRATMGSIFRVPFVYTGDICAEAEKFKASGMSVYAAYLHGGQPYESVDFSDSCAIMIGNEGNGLSDRAVSAASECVYIPMYGEVESLNAAIAAAVLMFH